MKPTSISNQEELDEYTATHSSERVAGYMDAMKDILDDIEAILHGPEKNLGRRGSHRMRTELNDYFYHQSAFIKPKLK